MADYIDITTMMDALVERTEEIVNEAYRCHKEESPREMSKMTSLVFPQYSADDDESQDKQKKQKEKTRISEQELRFAFVQAFHEYKCIHHCNYLYGVEVPTKDKYLFTEIEEKNGKKRRKYKPRIDKNGRSGSFDMVIYNEKLERVCLIEFKHGTPDIGSFAKDFLKLANQKEGKEGTKCYFIHQTKDKASNKKKLRSDIQEILTIGIEKIIYKSVILISK